MALSLVLGQAGLVADKLSTKADVALAEENGEFSIAAVHLAVEAAGKRCRTFETLATTAKTICPLSNVIRASITLSVQLID